MTQEVQGMLIQIEATTAQLRRELAAADGVVTSSTKKIDSQLAKVDSAFDRAGEHARSAAGLIKSAMAIAAGAGALGAIIQQADAYGQMASRIKMVTADTNEYYAVQRRLMEISDRTYKPIQEQQELFIRSSKAMKELGYSTAETVDFIDSASSSLTINAASAEAGTRAIDAFGKAMVTGTIRGDEWKTVMEVMPTAVGDVARHLGITETAVKSLASEGKLSMKQFVDAMTAARSENARLAEEMPATVGDAMTRLGNHFSAVVGEINGATAATSVFSDGINGLADMLADGEVTAGAIEGFTNWMTTIGVISDEIGALRDLVSEFASDTTGHSFDIGQAFADMPTNLRAAIQIAVVEIAHFIDDALNRAQAAAAAIKAIPGGIAAAGAAYDAVRAQMAGMDQARAESIDAIYAEREAVLSTGKAAADAYREQHKAAGELSTTRTKAVATETGLTKEQTKALKDQAKAMDTVVAKALPEKKRLQDLVANIKNLQAAHAKGKISAVELTQGIKNLNEEYASPEVKKRTDAEKRIADQIKKVDDAVQGVLDRLDPAAAATRKYTEEQNALNEAMKNHPERADEYRAALAKLGVEYQENQRAADQWAQLTQGAVDRVDEAFADAWRSVFDGSEDLWSGLKKGFKQTLAELAHMAITKPILISFASSVFGTSSKGGIGDVWGSLFSAASSSGESSGGSSGGGVIGMAQNAYSLYSALTGVGPEIMAGWQSGGFTGAVEGGVGYYSKLVSGAYDKIIGVVTGAAAAQAAQTALIQSTISQGITQGAAQFGGQFAVNAGTQVSWTAAQAAVAQAAAQGAAQGATGAAAGAAAGQVPGWMAALGSNPVGWFIAAITSAFQANKLYGKGVRADEDQLRQQFGGSGISQLYGRLVGGQANLNSKVDGLIGSIVGDRAAAVITGSPVVQALASMIGKAFGLGGGEQFKTTVGSATGRYSGGEYTATGAQAGWFEGSRQFGSDFDNSIHDMNKTFSSTLTSLFDAFDIDSDVMTSAAARLRRTSGRLAAEFTAEFDGQAITVMGQYGKKGNVQAAMAAWFDDVMGRGMVEAIAASSLPAYLKELTAGLTKAQDVGDTLGDLFTRFDGVNVVFDSLRLTTFALTDAGLRGADSLINLAASIAGLEDPAAAEKVAALGSLTSAYYQNFFTDAEKADDVIKAVTEQFKALGLTAPDSREAFRAIVDGVDKTTAAGQNTFFTLMAISEQTASYIDILKARSDEASQALANTANALQSLLMVGVDASYSMVQRSISAERDRLTREYNAAVARQQQASQQAASAASARASSINDMASTSQSLVQSLKSLDKAMASALDRVLGGNVEYVQAQRAAATELLRSALVAGRGGKSLTGFEGLEAALSTASELDQSVYSSLADFKREQGRTANLIASLQGINGKQLTAEEKLLVQLQANAAAAQRSVSGFSSGVSSSLQRQYEADLAALDEELAAAQLQIDALNGIDNSILSVGVAIDRMNAAMVAAINGQASAATGVQAAGSAATIDRLYQSILGYSANAEGQKFWQNAFANNTYSMSDLVAMLRAQASADARAKTPAFATGGAFTNSIVRRPTSFDMGLMGEAGPEGILPLANVGGKLGVHAVLDAPVLDLNMPTASAPDSRGDSMAGVVAELRSLRSEVQHLRQYAYQDTKNSGDTVSGIRELIATTKRKGVTA